MKLLEGVARQPLLASELQIKYFLAVGVTDGAFIIATGIGLWFATANPFPKEKDYLTSASPFAQKGAPVQAPIGFSYDPNPIGNLWPLIHSQ